MSGGNSTNNSWTILTSEETVADTLRPLAAGTEQREESLTSAADAPHSGENNQSANGAACAEGLPVEGYLVSEKGAEQNGHHSLPTTANDTHPSSLEVSGTLVQGSDEVSLQEGQPQDPAQLSPDPNLSSDSDTLITPSPEEPPMSLLSTESLGGSEFAEATEKLAQEGPLHLQNGDELHQEEKESDHYATTSDLGKQADSPADPDISEERTETTGEQGEPEEMRKRSLLAALEQIGRREEEEEDEVEEFQVPQREDDSGFSVNKCILGAVILLGLGTIFFSGIFMDLDEESDYVTRELKDEEPGKRDWLHPDTPPPQVDADNAEILNKLTKGSEQMSVLQGRLQVQKEELNIATGQSADEAKEQYWQEVEKENSRLKTEMASLPVLLKENDRMKKELESVPALQKEVETLRSTVTELKLSSGAGLTGQACAKPTISPPTGQHEDGRHDAAGSSEKRDKKSQIEQKNEKYLMRDKYEMAEKKISPEIEKSAWKESGKKEVKDAGKREWKKEKREQGKEKDKDGEQKRHSDEKKQWKEKDWKKENAGRGDDGKPWKDKESKKEWVQNGEKKERKEEKKWKKGKYEKVREDEQWRDKRDGQKKDHGAKYRDGEEWKGENEWKKGKDGLKESGKEKWERKDLKEKGDMKEWKKENEWKHKNGRDRGKEGKGKGERKQWEDGKYGKEGVGNGERKQWSDYGSKGKNGKQDKEWKTKNEKWNQWKREGNDQKRGEQKERGHNGEWKKDKSHSLKNKDEHKSTSHRGLKEEHLYGDQKSPHTHHKPSVGKPEYWAQQRERLRHDPRPPRQCNSLETCAQAERLRPVSLPEFEAVLQTYLSKAEEAGVDVSKREELKKLVTEFFQDGVFVHDKMSFYSFVDDVGDILEDMVEGDGEDEEESALEEEIERFEKEVIKRFSVPETRSKEEKVKGEWRKESGQGRG